MILLVLDLKLDAVVVLFMLDGLLEMRDTGLEVDVNVFHGDVVVLHGHAAVLLGRLLSADTPKARQRAMNSECGRMATAQVRECK